MRSAITEELEIRTDLRFLFYNIFLFMQKEVSNL